MTIIPISGIIASWELENESNVTPSTLRKSLEDANNDDILITINSPGGSVFHGFEMFSLIRNYQGNTETRIVSLAASMGSVLALAGQKKSIENTAMFYIHNAWSWAVGDYRDLEKEAKWLRDISDLIAGLYADNTTLNRKKAQELMDEESQFYGAELEDLGFTLFDTGEESTESEARIQAINQIKNINNKLKPEDCHDDLEKAVAMIPTKKYFSGLSTKQSKLNPAPNAGKNKQTEVIMNLEDFKKNHPELYAQVVGIGKDEEHDRVMAHIKMGKQCGDINIAVKNIEEKNAFSQSVTADYMVAGMKNTSLQNRKEDNPDTGSTTGDDDEAETQDLKNKILKARGLK